MMAYLTQLKTILAAAALALIVYATWYVTSDHYQKQIAEIQLGMSEAVQKELLARQATADKKAAQLKTAEEQHAKDQLTIDNLRAHPERLRLDQICGDSLQGGQTSQDRNGRAGLLSAAAEAAFAELQRGIDEDLARCDQLNIDARKFNASQ